LLGPFVSIIKLLVAVIPEFPAISTGVTEIVYVPFSVNTVKSKNAVSETAVYQKLLYNFNYDKGD